MVFLSRRHHANVLKNIVLLRVILSVLVFQPGIRIKLENCIQKTNWIQIPIDMGDFLEEIHFISKSNSMKHYRNKCREVDEIEGDIQIGTIVVKKYKIAWHCGACL